MRTTKVATSEPIEIQDDFDAALAEFGIPTGRSCHMDKMAIAQLQRQLETERARTATLEAQLNNIGYLANDPMNVADAETILVDSSGFQDGPYVYKTRRLDDRKIKLSVDQHATEYKALKGIFPWAAGAERLQRGFGPHR